ncbi:MAG: hypothetical protein HYR74_06005 [Candidatus Eisenbacteria bacterium]|nr:hypothetical protein [Candidatus Eisenbacteria bacterium]
MNPIEQIALAWQCLKHAAAQLLRPSLWAPWLVLGAVEVAVVLALAGFAHPALSPIVVPFLLRAGGEAALHYPTVFRMLPALFARADLVIGALLGSIVTGVSTALFAVRYAAVPAPRDLLHRALARAPALVIVSLPVALATLVLTAGLARWAGDDATPIVRAAGGIAALGIALVVQAWFVFGVPYIVLAGRGWLAALAGLPRAAGRAMVGALFLSIVAVVPSLPFQQLARMSDTIVSRGRPEMMTWVTLAGIAASLLGAFLLTGGATLLFQTAVAEPDDDAEETA